MRNPVVRDGMGYRWDLVDQGIVLRADRLHEQSETISAEVVVERAPDGHLLRTRINLLAGQTRAGLARQLSMTPGGRGVDWGPLLERFTGGVIDLHREGAPWEMVGTAPVRPEIPPLLRPAIYEGKPTILYGEGGLGKSTGIAAAMAISVATGIAILDCWTVVRSGPVVILDWEAESGDWNDALARICAARGIAAPQLHYRRMAGPLDGQVENVAARVAASGAVLVVIDSATHAARTSDRSGPEDSTKRLFDAIRAIGAASLIIDHRSKASLGVTDPATGSSPIGSIVKVNSARVTIELRQADAEDADGTRHLAMIYRKHNLTRRQEPIGVAIRMDDEGDAHLTRMWTEPVKLADTAVVAEVRRSGALWERAENILRVHGPMTALTLVGHLGMEGRDPVSQIENALRRKPAVFLSEGTERNTRMWSLGRRDDNLIPFPVTPGPAEAAAEPIWQGVAEPESSVSDRMAAIFAAAAERSFDEDPFA